jgi:hypothetical protein
MKAMASSITVLPVPHGAGIKAAENIGESSNARRRPIARQIDPRSGRALEILGHAIEYLTDEYVHAGGSLCAHNGQVEAIQLLIIANRAIYFACPAVPSLGDRLRRCLGLAPHEA